MIRGIDTHSATVPPQSFTATVDEPGYRQLLLKLRGNVRLLAAYIPGSSGMYFGHSGIKSGFRRCDWLRVTFHVNFDDKRTNRLVRHLLDSTNMPQHR